jgi:hypothetical protein
MTARFIVNIELDGDVVALEAKRAGLDLDRAREAVRCDLECRLHDAVQYRNGVSRVGVNVYRPQAVL